MKKSEKKSVVAADAALPNGASKPQRLPSKVPRTPSVSGAPRKTCPLLPDSRPVSNSTVAGSERRGEVAQLVIDRWPARLAADWYRVWTPRIEAVSCVG
jgi:hypothetical protein